MKIEWQPYITTFKLIGKNESMLLVKFFIFVVITVIILNIGTDMSE